MSTSPNDPDGPPESHLRILQTIRSIPVGRVATYASVALSAGLPRRARLVGFVLRTCPLADDVPWHRVVNASGRISERPGTGSIDQRRRLEHEGVVIDETGRIDLTMHGWSGPSVAPPPPVVSAAAKTKTRTTAIQ